MSFSISANSQTAGAVSCNQSSAREQRASGLGRENRIGKSYVAATGDRQQLSVAGNQQVRTTTQRQGKEFLIVGVAAARQWTIITVARRTELDEAAVASHQRLPGHSLQSEARVAADPLELGQTMRIAEAAERATIDCPAQDQGPRIGKMQEVENDVRVEDGAQISPVLEHRGDVLGDRQAGG